MGKRVNIGVYIGPDDSDIAAWFNLLQENKLNRARWVQGLFAAYAMHKSLPIGTVNPYASLIRSEESEGRVEGPMFGLGSSQSEIVKHDRYGYGWQIRGPHREFIHGSVINISISKAEILPIIEEAWQNGHRLATFLKALIRKNLAYGEQPSAPRLEILQKVLSEYMVLQNSKKLNDTGSCARRRSTSENSIKVARAKRQHSAAATASYNQKPDGTSSLTSETPKTFNFSGERISYQESGQASLHSDDLPQKTRNPLLAEI